MNIPSEAAPRPALRELTPLEARVLGVLVEKQHTVPDTYPLSLNSLTSGCNQKTARSPVMNVSEDEVLTTIDGLKRLSIVIEGSSSRVPRFEHNVNRVLGVPSQSVALLATLFLRGPQTAAELRANSARLHAFADISSVESFLDELAGNEPPRVVRLPRVPGERESRWMHLLCGEVSVSVSAGEPLARDAQGGEDFSASEFEALKSEQKRLAHEVAQLRAMVVRMAGELGMSLDQPSPDA
ncbi:YceH family protein [Caballeronia sp. LZ035]|uniref:YceH family protein n=1 Tax=Caballeronia sp. LZ035 TaxID=3038568 RepID=UPI0028555F67|nr:YceH family protein [Caballeronia sp. LZ035]MDR5760235.1 YceH family protein [Caballeronia sp. LZ035]